MNHHQKRKKANFLPISNPSFRILFPVILFVLVCCSKKNPPSSSEKAEIGITKETPKTIPGKFNRPEVKSIPLKVDEKIQYYLKSSPWVDSIFNTLSQEEKIGQLIMFDAYSYMPKAHLDSLTSLVKNYKIGGLIFFKGGPARQVNMINHLQSVSKVPLLIAMDAENGIGMRLDSTRKYPFQMTLGAIRDNNLIYQMGKAIANDIKRVGMQVNFAPVLDINSNSSNPVIGIRSFGENKYLVTSKSLAYMKGLQDQGVLATAKHFPGHGDTHVDSHRDLPLIKASRERLDTLELYPFKELIKQGLGGIMIAHMNIPSLDSTDKLPSTLSKKIVTGLLKNELGFKGLIFTDAMVMEGVSKYYPAGTSEPMAVIAGNDMIEKMKSAKLAIQSIKAAVDRGEIKQEEIDEKCKKILAVKQWCGLQSFTPIDLKNLYNDLNNQDSEDLIIRLVEASATLLNNKGNDIPIKLNHPLKIATLSLNYNHTSAFQKKLAASLTTKDFHLPLKASSKSINQLVAKLSKFDRIIVGIHDTRNWPGYKLNYTSQMLKLIDDLVKSDKAIITLFGSPYCLKGIKSIEDTRALLVMYENSYFTQAVAANIILGKMQPKGILPVTINQTYKIGDGIVE